MLVACFIHQEVKKQKTKIVLRQKYSFHGKLNLWLIDESEFGKSNDVKESGLFFVSSLTNLIKAKVSRKDKESNHYSDKNQPRKKNEIQTKTIPLQSDKVEQWRQVDSIPLERKHERRV